MKLKALENYRGVMREFPHPRSKEALSGLAAYRGGQSGLNYAEAFNCSFGRVKSRLTRTTLASLHQYS